MAMVSVRIPVVVRVAGIVHDFPLVPQVVVPLHIVIVVHVMRCKRVLVVILRVSSVVSIEGIIAVMVCFVVAIERMMV